MQVLEMTKKVFGHDHPSTLTCMNNLASMFSKLGWWKELKEQVLEMRKRVLGQEYLSTVTSMNYLASIYWPQTQRRGKGRCAGLLFVLINLYLGWSNRDEPKSDEPESLEKESFELPENFAVPNLTGESSSLDTAPVSEPSLQTREGVESVDAHNSSEDCPAEGVPVVSHVSPFKNFLSIS